MTERDELAALIETEIDKTSHRFPQESDYQRAADAVDICRVLPVCSNLCHERTG